MKNIISFALLWMLSNLVIAAPSDLSAQDKTLILTIQFNMGEYEVLDAKVVDGKISPRKTMAQDEAQLLFYLKDQHGFVMGQGQLDNPNTLRGVFAPGEEQAHGEYQQTQSVFVVRYPYQQGMEVIALIEESNQPMSRSASAVPVQHFNFSQLLKK